MKGLATTKQSACVEFEGLESRVLMAADGPRIIAISADNRGQVTVDFDQAVNAATLTRKSASIITAGVDGKFSTSDDVRVVSTIAYRKGKLTLTAALPANTYYRIYLDGNVIRGTTGLLLDGSFNGAGVITGNGRQGGSLDIRTVWPARTVARFSTVSGNLDVRLFGKNAPVTVSNFLSYANKGSWDNTFFHRSEATPLQVIQGGGFNVDGTGQVGSVTADAAIVKENGLSNTRGSIAMARTSDLNSATTQWFFNTQDNTELDTLNGGYCAFGTVTGTRNLAVMDALAAFPVTDATGGNTNSPFGELPLRNWTTGQAIDTTKNLLSVTRVAILMDIQATGAAAAAPAAAPAAVQGTMTPFSVTAVATKSPNNWLSGDQPVL